MKLVASILGLFRPRAEEITIEQRRAQAQARARALVAEIAASPPRNRKGPDAPDPRAR